jgi:hypothetical protein
MARPVGTLAIMQPYFVPYPGYFRLFQACDLVVLYDCVQFPRRGWVHRNQLPGHDQTPRWLTLPLEKVERDTPIQVLRFSSDAEHRLRTQFPRIPVLSEPSKFSPALQTALTTLSGSLVDYLERLLHVLCADLGLPCRTLRSSTLPIDPALHGQARIIAIAKHLGAKIYVNSPGGRSLYSAAAFSDAGMDLRFLSPYSGGNFSILQLIAERGASSAGVSIREQTQIEG